VEHTSISGCGELTMVGQRGTVGHHVVEAFRGLSLDPWTSVGVVC
jgi:hypothetical protein